MSDEGIGTETQQLARLAHAQEAHGLTTRECPACDWDSETCDVCDGWGVIFSPGDLRPCGPACPLLEVRPV